MFSYVLFDRINTDKQPDIEHTMFDRTDEKSLDYNLKMQVLLSAILKIKKVC